MSRHVIPSLVRAATVVLTATAALATARAAVGGSPALGTGARRGVAPPDDGALRPGRDRRRRERAARWRAPRARQDDRGGARRRRALPAAGLGGQRAAAARAARRPLAARPGAAPRVPARQGPLVDVSTTTSRSCRVFRRSPQGANFYPAGATKDEVERWMSALPASEKAAAQGFFTTIRRGPDGKLVAVPYSVEYQGELARAAELLREAAAATAQPSLQAFLEKRATAFLTNDYYESDVAWMELDATIEPTIGPYETYEDGWFGYKAAFEAFITLRDEAETAKLARLGSGAAVARGPAADRSGPAQPQARGARADPRRRRRLLGRRRQPRRADRRLQPAERRARRRREGQQARDAEEHAARQVRHGAGPDREASRSPRTTRRASSSTPSSRTS